MPTLKSGHSYKRWSELTIEEKERNRQLTYMAFLFVTRNKRTLLSYDQMNKNGLDHIYSFFIDEFNNSSQDKVEFNDYGIICI